MNKKTLFAAIAVFTVGLSGCATPPPTTVERGTTNFDYTPVRSDQKQEQVIAIVSPEFTRQDNMSNTRNSQNSVNLGRFANLSSGVSHIDFNSNFTSHHKRKLMSAMVNTFNEIVTSKGFNISGPYANFDDITYTDKKVTYLALVPQFDLYIEQFNTQASCSDSQNYCERIGTIQVNGSLNIKLIEPLTKQTFISKRINLSELTSPRDFVKRVYYRGQPKGLVEMAITKAIDAATETEPKPYIDNTQKVLTEALNEFYSKAMPKVDKYLSSEELLSFKREIESLKELKRF